MNYMYALRKIIFRWACLSEWVTQLHHRPQSKVSSIVSPRFQSNVKSVSRSSDVDALTDFLLHKLSAFLRHECKFFIQTSDMHLVNSFMNLYACLLDEIAAQEHAEGADRMSSSQVCIRHHHAMYLSCLKQIQNCSHQVFHIVRYAVLFD